MRITTFSPVKNEGPFLVEWVAWMGLIGANDIHVFTNDCTDGSDLILERLDEMGRLRHLPNPSVVSGTDRHHWTVIDYLNAMPRTRRSDWVMNLDVDEFPVIHVGAGRLADLVEAVPGADCIALNQLNFGVGGALSYDPSRLVPETCLWSQAREETLPGAARPRPRGVKTLVRGGAQVKRFANHSPLVDEADMDRVSWVDGSGRRLDRRARNARFKVAYGDEAAYGLAQVNHYALRNAESFLVKADRGRPNRAEAHLHLKYWKTYDWAEERNTAIVPHLPALRDRVADLLSDPELARLHAASVERHRARIGELLQRRFFARLHRSTVDWHRAEVLPGRPAAAAGRVA